MTTVSYPLRIPQEIVELAELRAKDERVDKTTALRQLLFLGAEEYILGLVEAGRISVGKAAEVLKISVHDIYRLAQIHGKRLSGTREQQKKSLEIAEKSIK